MEKLLNFKQFIFEKVSTSFDRAYQFDLTWWLEWEKTNKEKYEIKKDALTKTYKVYAEGKLIFIFDYSRGKIYTNETPEFFDIGPVSQKELQKIEIKKQKIEEPKGQKEEKKKKDEEPENI